MREPPADVSDKPLVSVLLPVRDGEAFLAEAIDSVLGQSLTDLELVVVDDGSVDATPALLRAVAAWDPRVRLVAGRGEGLVSALNAGLAACRGSFIARMDADDRCRPGRLRDQVDFLSAHAEVSVLGGQIRCFGVEGARQYRYPVTHAEIQSAAVFECPLAHPAVLFRAALVTPGEELYDSSQGNGSQDYELWTRWLEAGVGFAALPTVVLDYRMHPSQVTSVERPHQVLIADGLRLRWLRHLGLEPSPREMELHSGAGRGRWGRGLDYLSELERWLLKLRAAGTAGGLLDPDAFDRTLAQRWTSALWANRGLGRPLRSLASASPLRSLPHPQAWKPWAAWAGSFLSGPGAAA